MVITGLNSIVNIRLKINGGLKMAFTTGKFKIEGDIGKAVEFSKALK